MTKKERLAYFAGFFDGEGCISETKIKPRFRKKGKNKGTWCTPPSHVQVSIGNIDLGVLLDYRREFGGRVAKRKTGHFIFRIGGKEAENFLFQMFPFLKVKKPFAELALKIFKTQKRKSTFSPLTKQEKRIREDNFLKIHLLREAEKRENLIKEVT